MTRNTVREGWQIFTECRSAVASLPLKMLLKKGVTAHNGCLANVSNDEGAAVDNLLTGDEICVVKKFAQLSDEVGG